MVKRIRATKKQAETLRLLNLGYTVAEIAKKRKVRPQTVYNMLYRLEKRGVLNLSDFKRGVVCVKSPNIRLHALQYQIKILYKGPVYQKVRARSNIIGFGDFKIALYKDSLTLWVLRDFIGPTAKDCQTESIEYLYKTLAFIERKYNLTLVKRGYQNINRVRHHYAKLNDPLARKAIKENQPIQIRDKKDGKVWLSVDQSIKPPEVETIHKESAFNDMHEIIEPFFNTLKSDPHILDKLGDNTILLQDLIKTNTKQIKETSTQLKTLIAAIASFFPKKEKPEPEPEPEPLDPADYIG